MTREIERILELSGPMPDAAAHVRYLEGLPAPALSERLASLLADQQGLEDFWQPRRELGRPAEGRRR